jgi:4-amino-4-deoxy-L-arabinose transferase-like glycosyltransferase
MTVDVKGRWTVRAPESSSFCSGRDGVINGERDSRVQEAELRATVRPADPVWPNAPKAGAFFPLVLLMVLVLPWTHLVAHARMNADLATSGLRALDLLEGERMSDSRVVPPFPIWIQATALALPFSDRSLVVAAPSALFALLSGLALYRLGRVWYSPEAGVLAALLLISNRSLIEHIHTGAPGPVVLFFTLASLLPFAEHVQRQDDVFSRWTFLGGVALAGLFLTAGAYAFSMALLGLGAMFFRGDEDDSWLERFRKALFDPTTRAGVMAMLIGLTLAAPWLATAPWTWGPWFPWDPPGFLGNGAPGDVRTRNSDVEGLGWWETVSSAPALVVLAVFGLLHSIRDLFREGATAERDALPILWTLLAVAAFALAQRTPAALLVVTAPMFLLAARTILDILERKLLDRQVLQLAAAAVGVFVVWQTTRSLSPPLGSRTGLKLSGQDWIAVASGVVGVFATLIVLTVLYRWTRDSDSRRRSLFGALVVAVLVVACAPGVMLLRTTPRSADPWHQAQQRLSRLIDAEKPDLVLFLDPERSSLQRRTPVLEFLVRTLAPQQERRFVVSPDELEQKLAGFDRPLVIVAQSSRPLPKIYSFSQGSRVLTLAERLHTDRVTAYSPLSPPRS